MSLFASRIASLGTENAFSVGVDIAKVAARGVDVIRLNIGEPDCDSAPHINEAAIEQIRAGNSHYTDPQGILPLRTAICNQIKRTRGLDVTPDRVIVTTGGKPGIGFTIQSYVNPGDEVIYPSPGFPIYESWITYAGGTAVPLPLHEETGFTFTPDDLKRLITPKTRVIFLCSPSNPTGGVLSKAELAGIARVIVEHAPADVRVYSDEIYEDCIFDGEQHHSIAVEPGMQSKTIIASGHSKGFAMTGWRLGYVVLPTAEEASVFKQLTINTVSCVPPFIQEAGRVALESPESQPYITRMVSAFQDRRDWVVKALNAIPGVRCQNPKGAFYVFPNVAGVCQQLGILDAYAKLPEERRHRTSPSSMLQMFLLYRYGVATMDRNSFGKIGAEGQHFLRLSIATSLERLKEGVERIRRASTDTEGFAAFLREEKMYG
ncbi:MAG TPA: pyridoxal phosphate-dependent aminotransferase [Gemmatimonadaceae bacterium]|jgi:aspartate aminotransferase|nr:pyridoxal phosphate-dependent aminotransferase [Gemmatimonadaceae bacterium]